MTNRIEQAFHHPVFAAYYTAGDGNEDYLVAITEALEEGGVNLLEIGFPFSDPLADGPVIQQAMQRSLQNKTGPRQVLNLAARIRRNTEMPLILFSYYNPILIQGEHFLQEVKQAGFDGVLVVDLPLEEGREFYEKVQLAGLVPIFIATPSTSEERLQKILKDAKGFLYYVLQKGTTGARESLPEGFENHIKRIKNISRLPVLAGFGISNQHSAKKALEHAEGFVVGSALVKLIAERQPPYKIKAFIHSLDPRGEYVRQDE